MKCPKCGAKHKLEQWHCDWCREKLGVTPQADSPLDGMVRLRWIEIAPVETGWYWYKGGIYDEVVHVFERPGHHYLCIYGEPSGTGKREFVPVTKIGGQWAGPIQEPAAT